MTAIHRADRERIRPLLEYEIERIRIRLSLEDTLLMRSWKKTYRFGRQYVSLNSSIIKSNQKKDSAT